MRAIISLFRWSLPLMLATFFAEMPTVFAQAPIACDGDLASQLASSTDIKAFSFLSIGNEYATIHMWAYHNSTIVCRIELYAPDGQQIASAQAASFVADSATIPPVKLELPGEYIVKAMSTDDFFFSGGEFGLSVQVLRPDCALHLVCNASQEKVFDMVAQTEAYWFVAQPGDHFIFRLLAIDFLLAQAIAYTQDGDLIAGAQTSIGGEVRIDFDFSALSEPDTIFLLMRNGGNYFFGEYSFAFQHLRASCAQPLACDTDLSGEISYLAMEAFYLPVQPGDRMLLRAKGNYLQLEFFHKDGSPWLLPLSDEESLLSVKQTFSAVDTLLIIAMRYSVSSIFNYTKYGLSIQMLRPDCAPLLTCNVPLGDSILYTTQVDAFRFDIAGGEKVLLRTGSTWHHWGRLEIYSPNSFPNTFWEMEETNTSAQLRFEMQLDIPGTWYALFMEKDWHNMDINARYGVSYHQLDDPNCGQPISYNTNLALSSEFPGEVDAFVLNGTAGEVLMAQAGNCEYDYYAALQLYDSLGNRIAADYTQIYQGGIARLDTFRLPASGRYQLLAFENEGYKTGQYGFSMQKLNPGYDAIPLALGQVVMDSLDYRTDTHIYSFFVSQGGSFTLKAETDESGFDWSLFIQIYDPSGRLIVTINPQPNATIFKEHLPLSGTYTVLAYLAGECETKHYDLTLTSATSILEGVNDIKTLEIFAYPNPFSENINIEFDLLHPTEVFLEIIDITGKRIVVLANGELSAGHHTFNWQDERATSGIYLARLCTHEGCVMKQLVLSR